MRYIAEKWREILVFNNLDSHEKIWALQAEWFEEPNHCRGGWSGVSRIELKLPEGGIVGAFLKRQENHVTRTLRNPIKGVLTFSREFEVLRVFNKHKIPSLDLILFDQWEESGCRRGCIITEELAGYLPLSSEEYRMGGDFLTSADQKARLFVKIAALMHLTHQQGFKHGCFYPKHIFVKQLPEGDVDLRVIDLEKVKKFFCKKRAAFRDLDTLLRHSNGWSEDDKLAFFKVYQGEYVLKELSKQLWKKLCNRKK
ncbi:MAG: lipopolysaccharide kinase [Cycloclasticus sp. symbiont of Poecilosclerida sp. M]|nr:MAG: lipopolysaccharide kinase [Cycloclasticus sp. symbiont of Poecilosclerida sp. M]